MGPGASFAGNPGSPGSMQCPSWSRWLKLEMSMAEVSAQRISGCSGWKHLPSWAAEAFCPVAFGGPLHSDQTCGRGAATSSEPPCAGRSCRLPGFGLCDLRVSTHRAGSGSVLGLPGAGGTSTGRGMGPACPALAARSMPVSYSQALMSPSL